MKFVNNLRKELKSHARYPENVQSFLTGLSDAMKIPVQLTKLLSGCIVSDALFIVKSNMNSSFFVALFSPTDKFAEFRRHQTIAREHNE